MSILDLLETLPDLAEAGLATSREDRDPNLRDPVDMKIAWRYSTVPRIDSTIGGTKSKFDLNKKMSQEKIDKSDIRIIEVSFYNDNFYPIELNFSKNRIFIPG